MAEKQYACKKMCFVGSLIRVGEVVGEATASLAPACFVELTAKGERAMQDEIEELIPEVKESRKGRKKYTARDLLNAKAEAATKVNGDPKK